MRTFENTFKTDTGQFEGKNEIFSFREMLIAKGCSSKTAFIIMRLFKEEQIPSWAIDCLFGDTELVKITFADGEQEVMSSIPKESEDDLNQAASKLSKKQKDILFYSLKKLNLDTEDSLWKPAVWAGTQNSSGCASFSRSLKQLESRGLVVRKTGASKKRTLQVRFTELGFRVLNRLIDFRGGVKKENSTE